MLIDSGIRIPLEFRRIQTANLVDWHGAEPHAEFTKVVQALTALLGAAPMQAAPEPESPVHPEPQAETPRVSDVEATLEPPPSVSQPSTEEMLPSQLHLTQKQNKKSGKKSLAWGIVAVLLLSLPISRGFGH